VATIKAVINSAYSIRKYEGANYNPIIINAAGEFDSYSEELKKKNLPVYVKDATGQLVAQEWDDATYTSPFYDINRKPSNYVPNYSDAIYLRQA
jgi:hypothetical protein